MDRRRRRAFVPNRSLDRLTLWQANNRSGKLAVVQRGAVDLTADIDLSFLHGQPYLPEGLRLSGPAAFVGVALICFRVSAADAIRASGGEERPRPQRRLEGLLTARARRGANRPHPAASFMMAIMASSTCCATLSMLASSNAFMVSVGRKVESVYPSPSR